MRIPVIMLILLPVLTILIDLYIWDDIHRACRRVASTMRRNLYPRIYLWSAVACWIFLAVILSLPRRGEGNIIPIMWMIYAFLTLYIPKFIFAVLSLIGRIPLILRHKPVRLGLYLGIPAGICIFAMMWYGAFAGRHKIEVTNVEIDSPRIPQSFDNFRIVQFSDAHVGTWGTDTTFISNLVDTINSLRPDIIVFTGDIVNRHTDELIPFVSTLSRLHAPKGVYAVLGNHDYGDYMDWPTGSKRDENNRKLSDLQTAMGWKALNNSTEFIHAGRDSIALIGVENWGEPPFKQYGDLNKAYSFSSDSTDNVTDGKFKILLSHNPEHWRLEVIEKSNIDLTLSGHTHAMQFLIEILGIRWSPAQYRYAQWGGLYQSPRTDIPQRIYVNIGCGEVGMPFRIGATPEVTLITLKRTTSASK